MRLQKVRDFTWLKPELNLRISVKTEICECGGEGGRTPIIMKMCIIPPFVERLLRKVLTVSIFISLTTGLD